MKDCLDSAIEERPDECWREPAIGSECDAIVENHTVGRFAAGMNGGEDFALYAQNIEGRLWINDTYPGVVVECCQSRVIADSGFHGSPQTVVPQIGTIHIGICANKSIWKPEPDASCIGEVIGVEQFLEAEDMVTVQVRDKNAVDGGLGNTCITKRKGA